MKALGIIIQREYNAIVRTKAFLLTTILMPVFMVIMAVLPTYLTSVNDADIAKVYVVDRTGIYSSRFVSSDKYKFEVITENEFNTIDRSKMYSMLQIDKDLNIEPNGVTFFAETEHPPKDLVKYINTTLNEAVRDQKLEVFSAQANIDPGIAVQVQQILKEKDSVNVTTISWFGDSETNNALNEASTVLALLLTTIMLFFVLAYGSMVMQSVTAEKSNRIVEVIISSTSPFNLLMGKIIAVALAGLTQVLIWVVISVIIMLTIGSGNSFSGDMTIGNPKIDVFITASHSINWLKIAGCFILYFIGGYLLYASIFATFGSAANEAQEAQQYTKPVTIILLLSFYIGIAGANNPDGTLAFWGSLIPFTSPIVMMVRMPFKVSWWEIITSLVVLYASAILMVKVAGKIYRIGILTYGKKISMKELVKWLKYK